MTKLGEENDQTGGGRSFDDCDNICEWNLLFDVIFRKFMRWLFRICAQVTSGNVYFFHYKRSKWKPHFFRGSFTRLTSQVRRGTCLVDAMPRQGEERGLLHVLPDEGVQSWLVSGVNDFWLHNIYFKKISDTKNTYMIYENDQLTKLIKNTKTIHIYNILSFWS